MRTTGYVELKKFMLENGIKQREIAEMLGVGASTMSQKLNRRGADFSLAEVRVLCDAYSLDPEFFFLGSNIRNSNNDRKGD